MITRRRFQRGRGLSARRPGLRHGWPGESADLGPENALDGDPYTRWASAGQDPQWLTVDLGRVRTVDGVTLVWETAFADAYDLQVSIGNSNWRSVFSVEHGRGGTGSIAYPPVKARYVRIYGRRRATQWGYSLWDILVHGK